MNVQINSHYETEYSCLGCVPKPLFVNAIGFCFFRAK